MLKALFQLGEPLHPHPAGRNPEVDLVSQSMLALTFPFELS